MLPTYNLLDIPATLTPPSFASLKPISSNTPTQPRNPPEPKGKKTQWPQAEDLKKLHDRYGKSVEQALQAAHDDGIREWSKTRIERTEDNNAQDIRQWHEMFKVMSSFGCNSEKRIITISDEGSDSWKSTDKRLK
jgi:hypothetical protein